MSLAQSRDCGLTTTINKNLANSLNDLTEVHAAKTSFLIGGVLSENVRGSVIIKKSPTWTAWQPKAGEFEQGLYSLSNGDIAVLTMTATEGPGSSWTFVRANHSIAFVSCSEITFPNDLNSPSFEANYLEPVYFKSTGHTIEIIGVETVARSNGKRRSFRYLSHDDGKSWSTAALITRQNQRSTALDARKRGPLMSSFSRFKKKL